jgi:hypothetical protein
MDFGKQHKSTFVVFKHAAALRGRFWSGRRSSTTPDLEKEETFVTIEQFTKRPIHGLSQRRECFYWLRMTTKKLVSTHDTEPSVFSGLKRLP